MKRACSSALAALWLGAATLGCGSKERSVPDTTEADCAAFVDYTRQSFRSLEQAVPQRERAAPEDAVQAAAVQSRLAEALDAVANAPPRFTSPTVSELERRFQASYAARAKALRRANEGLVSGDPAAAAEARAMDQQADADLASVMSDHGQRCARATAPAGASASAAPPSAP